MMKQKKPNNGVIKKQIRWKTGGVAFMLLLSLLAPLFVPGVSKAESVVSVDGKFSDWDSTAKLSSDSSDIQNWAVQKDDTKIYFYVHELTGNQYSHPEQTITVNYSIGSNNVNTGWGKYESVKLPWNLLNVTDSNSTGISDASIAYSQDPSEGYDVEFSVPIAYFNAVDPNFSFSYVGSKIAVADIPVVATSDAGTTGTGTTGSETTTGETTRPAYSGIKIDGQFSDWQFKDTTAIDDKNIKGLKTVWDDKYLYVYMDENPDSYEGNIANTGAKGNGQFAIITDNNRKTTFFARRTSGSEAKLFLDQNGQTIIDGSSGAYNAHRYEFKIPIDQIKDIKYTTNLAVAIYGSGETDATQILESGITDISGKHVSEKSTDGIKMDGLYSDWNGFTVQDIDYTTSGGKGPDGVGSLFYDHSANMIYGHTYGKAQNKTAGKYENDITPFSIFVNGKDEGVMLTAVKVNGDGNSSGSGEGTGKIMKMCDGSITTGTDHYYLVDVGAPISLKNTKINSPEMKGHVYGEIWITAGNKNYEGNNVEAEFELYPDTIMKHYGLDEHSLRSVQTKFQDLGNQKLTTEGASSGPVLGIILSLLTLAMGYLYVQKKRENSQKAVAALTPEKKNQNL
jgi:uncharacterized protein (TIGR04145 family)